MDTENNHIPRIISFLFLVFTLAIGGCLFDSDNDNNGGGGGGTANVVQAPIKALPGDPGALAIVAIYDLDAITGIPANEIEEDETGVKIARTELDIGFIKTATVGEINTFLESFDGSIVAMLEGVAAFLVRFPDPGSLADLETLINQLEGSPLVRWTEVSYFSNPDELPPGILPSNITIAPIDHHLAVKGHALWNLRNLLTSPAREPPVLIVADYFGEGVPNADYEAQFIDSDFALVNSHWHGYGVTSVIVADYGGDGMRGNATGLYPGNPIVRVVDLCEGDYLTLAEASYRSLHTVKEYEPFPVILNTSLGNTCNDVVQVLQYCNEDVAREQALTWIEKVRSSDLEDKYIHVTSAGNIKVATDTNALYNSRYASAALFADLTDEDGAPVPALSNTLVVENLINTDGDPPRPACLDKTSKYHGNISAIGTDVWMLAGADSGIEISDGTSYATPQVAALATWIWELAPNLTNAEVIQLIKDTAQFVDISNPDTALLNCAAITPSEVIDTYSAALSIDAVNTTIPSNSPVRVAALDVNNDSLFNEKDLQLLVNAYYDMSAQDQPLMEPLEPDYSRYDLNGDGWTGGSKTAAFDLERIGSYQYGRSTITSDVTQNIAGTPVVFDENLVKDTDIMCYYAYSSLYTGNTTDRNNLIAEKCGSSIASNIECKYMSNVSTSSTYYSKECLDTATDIKTIIAYNSPSLFYSYGEESINLTTKVGNDPLLDIWWVKASSAPSYKPCVVQPPDDWFVILNNNLTIPRVEWWEISNCSWGFPCSYILTTSTSNTELTCWPDWSPLNYYECGLYVCPDMDSIQSDLPFPGDCHQWWDHFDENGIWVECNY